MSNGKCGLFFERYAGEAQVLPSRFQKTGLGLFMLALLAAPLVLDSYMVSVLTLINISVIGAVSLNLLTGFCGQISLGHGAFLGVGAYASAQFSAMGLPFFVSLTLGGAVAAVRLQ